MASPELTAGLFLVPGIIAVGFFSIFASVLETSLKQILGGGSGHGGGSKKSHQTASHSHKSGHH